MPSRRKPQVTTAFVNSFIHSNRRMVSRETLTRTITKATATRHQRPEPAGRLSLATVPPIVIHEVIHRNAVYQYFVNSHKYTYETVVKTYKWAVISVTSVISRLN